MACWWPCCDTLNRCFIFGGGASGGVVEDRNDSYDHDVDTWATSVAMPDVRVGQACSPDGLGNIFATGGRDASAPKNTHWNFSNIAGSWAALSTFPSNISDAGDQFDKGPNVFGGNNGTSIVAAHKQWFGGVWASLTNMPAARTLMPGSHIAGLATILMGGNDGVTTHNDNTWSYDSVGDAFTTKTNFPVAIFNMGAINDGADVVGALGGQITGGSKVDTNHLYSIAGDSYSSGATLSANRQRMRGLNHVAGGGISFGGSDAAPVSVTESYDFTGNSWTARTNVPGVARERSGGGTWPV